MTFSGKGREFGEAEEKTIVYIVAPNGTENPLFADYYAKDVEGIERIVNAIMDSVGCFRVRNLKVDFDELSVTFQAAQYYQAWDSKDENQNYFWSLVEMPECLDEALR